MASYPPAPETNAGILQVITTLVDHPGNLDMEEPLDHSKNCMHFDQGETEAVLDLPPGKHTLQLLLGDEDHEPTDPPLMSKKITITVQ
ncbi:DUF4399 domain-containing protein [Thiolapillus sp.]|uniref:DUF4399 domain-containing protein n=1 Tax=Thiolapillus sp. TaxID=2017437 RepID=UPI003AF94E22